MAWITLFIAFVVLSYFVGVMLLIAIEVIKFPQKDAFEKVLAIIIILILIVSLFFIPQVCRWLFVGLSQVGG